MDTILVPGSPGWPQARVDAVHRRIERNEAWAEELDWHKRVEMARKHNWPLPVAGGLYKSRWDLSQGGIVAVGGASGWEIDDMPIVDFGVNTSVAQNAFVRSGFNMFPLVNPFAALGSPDPEPWQEPGGTLVAITNDRQVGAARLPSVVCAGCFLVHSTGAGAVYQPAATATVNVRVQNNVTTLTGGLQTQATFNVTTGVNFIEQMPIVATAGRGLTTPDGVAHTNVFLIFAGDFVIGELGNSNAAALNVQGNILFAMLELV